MKYEKFLKQIADKAIHHLYWANVHINMAKNSYDGDNLFDLIGHVEHSIFRTQWETNNHEWLKQAGEIQGAADVELASWIEKLEKLIMQKTIENGNTDQFREVTKLVEEI